MRVGINLSHFCRPLRIFWDKIIDLNYRGTLNTCYVILPEMVTQKSGAIVNISSDAGPRGGSMGEAIYAGCKAGIIAFSKTIAP